ncbi:hypothetical protein LOTGIDRAFT_154603 [Lottia gigantea]|uniref:Disease resistance R13L4/SHOC-2-like LRR domain-containing protein n=1 Tax=Lottia gigantea TaxID=225164 RepID=V3Z8B3_LOTGI|nr:hypothetical protein LOTGIDRAFT_154603 [Lottia gigantea]ESO87113.1 hypothetical protein LOTGIDRAFT_154603 [Lottia gigantea]
MPKEKQNNDNVHNRRQYTLMSSEDIASGKKSSWYALEISGLVKNISPELWGLQFLSSLFLSDNHLTHLPPEICKLYHLTILDLSNNKLRSLPAEIGDLIQLRELLLNYNCLRVLPYEIGKLFQLHSLGLQGNPLNPELNNLYNECNGTNRLLSFMLDSLPNSHYMKCYM